MFAKYLSLALVGMMMPLAQALPTDASEEGSYDRIPAAAFDFHYSIKPGVSAPEEDYHIQLGFSRARPYSFNGEKGDEGRVREYTCVKAKYLDDGHDLELSALWMKSVYQTSPQASLAWVVVFADDNCDEKNTTMACATDIKETKPGEKITLGCLNEKGQNWAELGSGIPPEQIPEGAFLARSVAIYGEPLGVVTNP